MASQVEFHEHEFEIKMFLATTVVQIVVFKMSLHLSLNQQNMGCLYRTCKLRFVLMP